MQTTPLAVFAVALILSCCTSSSRDIRGRDHGAFLPAFRTLMDLRGKSSDAPSKPITELELDIAGADGDMHNSGVVTGEYRLVEGGASIRLGRQFRDRVRLVSIMGVGFNRVDLVDRSAPPFVDDKTTEAGFRLGGELRLRFTDWFWWHGRIVSFMQPFDIFSTQSEVGFFLGRPDEMGVLFGYKDWRYRRISGSSPDSSPVNLHAMGHHRLPGSCATTVALQR
jgi:hypothetical protein